ncbi:MAG: diaminopimelate decarboxylase, partial [Lentimicrobium sp.]|nr:diaminopimelate decarboxylase [Lentimicrobium sp.]
MKLNYESPIIKKLNAGMMNKFGSRTEYTPVKFIDNVAVADLMNKYGSPLFVISEKTIRQNYQKALKAFKMRYPKVQFAWSYKTNYLDAVCQIFHQEGSWAEVVSGFEYQKALRNGVPGNLIIFNGPDKSKEDLIMAIENRSLIHIDHFDELYMLIEILEDMEDVKARVAIRVNMDTGIYPQWDRFGFNYENGQAWNAIMKIVAKEKLQFEGLHCHIGTYILTANAYAVAARKMCELALAYSNTTGENIKYIDMGG